MKIHRKIVCFMFFCQLLLISSAAWTSVWRIPDDFATIQDAMDSEDVVDRDRIFVDAGEHAGAVVTKAVTIMGMPGAVITTGPLLVSGHPCHGDLHIGFRFGFEGDPPGSGTVIKNLSFEGVAFPVFSRGADDVKVIGCHMEGAVQGVTNSGGVNWKIFGNQISDLRAADGGGIGIVIGDRKGRQVSGNQIHLNQIGGTLDVASCESGGYNGAAIVLYADYRWDGLGAERISENGVKLNHVSVTSNASEVVDMVGIELTDTRADDTLAPVIYDNDILLNIIWDMTNAFQFVPETLEDENFIWFNRTYPGATASAMKAMNVRSSPVVYY